MSRAISQTSRFKRQYKLAQKRGKDTAKLLAVIEKLAVDEALMARHKDHSLIGNFDGCRECHIEPDWLLIYRLTGNHGLELVETGSHADLFS